VCVFSKLERCRTFSFKYMKNDAYVKPPGSLYEILQILSLNLFEKTSLDAALTLNVGPHQRPSDGNQLILFN